MVCMAIFITHKILFGTIARTELKQFNIALELSLHMHYVVITSNRFNCSKYKNDMIHLNLNQFYTIEIYYYSTRSIP